MKTIYLFRHSAPDRQSTAGGREGRRETILEQNKAKRSRGGLFFAIQAGI